MMNHLRRILIVFVCFLWFVPFTVSGDEADKGELDKLITRVGSLERPRLFLNRQILASIKAQMTPDRMQFMEKLKRRVDGFPLEPKLNPAERVYASPNDWGTPAADTALLYLLTGQAQYLIKATNLLKFSVDWYNQRFREGKPVDWYATSRISALCAFDWVYDALSETQRKEIGAALLSHILQAQDSKTRPALEGPSGPDAGFYGAPNLKWYAGLVFLGAGLDDVAATRLLSEGYRDHLRMFELRSEAAGDDGGSVTGCVGYAGKGDYQRQEWKFFHSWRAVMETAFAPRYPRLALLPNWLLWNAIPGPGGSMREFGFGDSWHRHNRWQPSVQYLAQFRHFYGHMTPEMCDVAEALLARIAKGGLHESFLGQDLAVIYFLFTPPALDDKPFSLPAGLPRARHFAGLGQIFMNSGWDEFSTYCLFVGGSSRPLHKHYDESHFIIYRQGYLALDSGTRGASGALDEAGFIGRHTANYYRRTIAHNCVTIRMEGDETDDGGMESSVGSTIVAFETNPHFTYIACDATKCYPSDKCVEAIRQFVFIVPDFFVVFDRVTSKKPEHKKTWLLHTVEEPTISGDTFEAIQEDGKIYCRTLLPQESMLEKIGGPGKEFWSKGRNWPLPGARESEPRRGVLYGQWRVEISPRTNEAQTRFLHLIQVGDKNALTTMTPAKLIRRKARIGVEFQAGPYAASVLFNHTGAIAGGIRLAWGQKILFDRDFPDKVQEQAGLALDREAAKRGGPRWTSMRQGQNQIENHEDTTDQAPIALRLENGNAPILPDQIDIRVDGQDAKHAAQVVSCDAGRAVEIKIDTAKVCRPDELREGSRLLSRTILVSYFEPVFATITRFSRRIHLPSTKPAPHAIFLSDLKEDAVKAYSGQFKWFNKDGDYRGNPLNLGPRSYRKGLFLMPPDDGDLIGSIEYTLPLEYRQKTFKAVIGINQTPWDFGAVVFRVKLMGQNGNWRTSYESPCLSRGGKVFEIAIPLRGSTRLRLESDAGSDNSCDHSVWADARLE